VTIAVIALAVALALVALLLGWQIYRADSRADQLVEERAKHSATTKRAEIAEFRLDAAGKQLAIETKRANAFEEALADVQANPNSDLQPRDIRERVRRAAKQAQAAAADRASAARAEPERTVPSPATSERSEPAAVSGGLDPNERLL
jgi:hypothetical protein